MTTFDPNAAASKDSGIFGLPFSINEAKLILIPVPWEATTSYGGGTSKGPEVIFNASKQIDLFDRELGNFFEAGIAMLSESEQVRKWNDEARQAALVVIGSQGKVDNDHQIELDKVNDSSNRVNEYVYNETKKILTQGKIAGIVGGDHSTPYGAIKAFVEKYPDMSVLHFDAHADMRNAFEGFEHSHASIMYNVMTQIPLRKLVQVGIRDFCEEELHFIQKNKDKVATFFDVDLIEQKMDGKTWSAICENIIKNLSKEVYVSFDIDGLDPRFCPHTGTPVPGGLDFSEALFLLKKVVQSGRKIIGFDLNEVSPGSAYDRGNGEVADPMKEWDANVGARLLYKLCGWAIYSNK